MPGLGLGAPQFPERVGALDADESTVAVHVREAERAKLAEAQTSTEGDIEEVDVKGIRFVSERVGRRVLEERGPDGVSVRRRDLLPAKSCAGGRLAPDAGLATMLADGVRQHLAGQRPARVIAD